MRATTIHAPADIRLSEVPDPVIEEPTDAIVRVVAGCICGSDLWSYRGANKIRPGATIGHEAVGIVEAVGSEVRGFRGGEFVIVPFCHSDNTCPHCRAGFTSVCERQGWTESGQAELTRVSQADGTLVATDGVPDDALVPSLLTLSDVMATGWHAAVASRVAPGGTAVVVGDGAVGLCGVVAAKELGAERIVVMSRHEPRQRLALELGATDLVEERDDAGVAAVHELTGGVGADSVLECVGTDQSMKTAFRVARPGATVGFVGAPHGVELPVRRMFDRNIALAGGMAPVRAYLPHLLDLILDGRIDPGRVFDLTLPLEDVADGYRAMDERRAIKVLLRP